MGPAEIIGAGLAIGQSWMRSKTGRGASARSPPQASTRPPARCFFLPRNSAPVCCCRSAAREHPRGAFPPSSCGTDAGAMTIERVVSPAGIEAWLVEDHILPVVAIRFAFSGGACARPRPVRAGSSPSSRLCSTRAPAPYDTAAFQTRLEDLVTALQFHAGRDQLSGSLRTLKRNLGEVEELLRLALTEPRFEPSAIERVRGQIVASLAQQAQKTRARSPAACGCETLRGPPLRAQCRRDDGERRRDQPARICWAL